MRDVTKLLAQMGPHIPANSSFHVVVEIGVIEIEIDHGKTRDTREARPHEAFQRGSVLGWKFLQDDQARFQIPRVFFNGCGKSFCVDAARYFIDTIEMPFS